MIDAHQAQAEQTGARLVHACGMDSIPSDMGVFFLQRKAKELQGKPCSHVKMRVKAMKGGFSGGTAASLIHGMEKGPRDPSIMRYMTEPYSLNPEGQRHGADRPDKMMSVAVKYDEDLQAWTKPFFMGPMNTKIVRRSNALLGYPYGEDFRYEEATLVGSLDVSTPRSDYHRPTCERFNLGSSSWSPLPAGSTSINKTLSITSSKRIAS